MTPIPSDPAQDLARIKRFLREHKMPVTLFGRQAAKDPRLVGDLENGRQMRKALRLKVYGFMAAYVPAAA
jgi:hypothetical protein